MTISEEPGRAIVRMFPDYGDTVLWFAGLPVDYEVAGLTEALVRSLKDWEQSYYDSLTRNLEWKSAELAGKYAAEGVRLAQLLADELGEAYQVEFKYFEHQAQVRRFRGGVAANVKAAAAFDALAVAQRLKDDEIARGKASEQTGDTGWSAYSPQSGKAFKPPR
ncbi:hypothetical protein ACIQC5_08340 [Paenarthrobacter sp. NPDC092416]|uniref:hypothetical protein n=1 Tax=Paenarthrobacter sp. NPDC092416 TaxID=3364386 RepID=UPI0038044111